MSTCVISSELPESDKQDIARASLEKQRGGMPKKEADVAAAKDKAAELLDEHDRIMQQVRRQLKAKIPDLGEVPKAGKQRPIKAPETPDAAATSSEGVADAEAPADEPVQILGRDPQKRGFQAWNKEALKDRATQFMRYASVKVGGKSTELLRKLYEGGDQRGDAFSKLLPGKISVEAAIRAKNNVMHLVDTAMLKGRLKIEADGRIHVQNDDVNNFRSLGKLYTHLRATLADMGYHEQETHPDDPQTVANALAAALYGPRMQALEGEGVLQRGAMTQANKDLSTMIRNDPRFAPLLHEYESMSTAIRRNVIENQVASGRYTEAQAKTLMDRMEYIPLNKMADEDTLKALADPTQKNSLKSLGFEHHVGDIGGTIGDPLENFYNKMALLDSKAVKNVATNLMADGLIAIDEAHWGRGGSDMQDRRNIPIRRNGKDKVLHVSDLNVAAAFEATPVLTGVGWDFARKMRDVSRTGATLMPSFGVRMGFHDAQRVSVQSDIPMLAAHKEVAKNFAKGLRKEEDPTASLMRSYGVIRARDAAAGLAEFKDLMLDRPESTWHKIKQQHELITAASDGAARMTVFDKTYKDAKARGMSDTDAEFQAAHSAGQFLDYNEVGSSRSYAALMTVAPFINSTVRGTLNMVEALRGNLPGVSREAARAAAWRRVGTMAAFTLAYAAVRGGDPEYENASQEDRNSNFLFPGGIKMPVAYELMPFKVLAETAAREMLSNPNEDWSKSEQALRGALADSFLGPSEMMGSAIRPIVEAATNHSFMTGRDLVGKSLLENSTPEQATPNTTEFSKSVSSIIQPAAQAVGLKGISPIVLENFVTGYLGRTGTDILNALRWGEYAEGDRPEPTASQTPFIGAMVANPHPTGLRDDFQDVVNKVQSAQADLRTMAASGRMVDAQQFRQENRDALGMASQVTGISRQLAAINKQLRNPTISTDRRDQLQQQMTQVLQITPKLRERLGF